MQFVSNSAEQCHFPKKGKPFIFYVHSSFLPWSKMIIKFCVLAIAESSFDPWPPVTGTGSSLRALRDEDLGDATQPARLASLQKRPLDVRGAHTGVANAHCFEPRHGSFVVRFALLESKLCSFLSALALPRVLSRAQVNLRPSSSRGCSCWALNRCPWFQAGPSANRQCQAVPSTH